MKIEPRSYFTIVRQIGNHTDSATYYVRATIRNARTDALITTVGLTDKGNRRFSYAWQAPEDSSGLGFYVSILTEVFTDSGYTTKGDYSDEMETYLIQAEKINLGGGFSGPSIDYKKIEKIVRDAIDTIPKNEPFDDADVIKAIDSVSKELGVKIEKVGKIAESIDIPEADMSPVIAKIDSRTTEIAKRIDSLPRFEKTDLSAITEALKNADMAGVKNSLQKTIEAMKIIDECMSQMKDMMDAMPEHSSKLDELTSQLKSTVLGMMQGKVKVSKDEPSQGIINQKYNDIAKKFNR